LSGERHADKQRDPGEVSPQQQRHDAGQGTVGRPELAAFGRVGGQQ
jgi:hypothetical protein